MVHMPAVLVPAAAATASQPLHVVDEITLARVPAWPVERALRLLASADWRAEVARLFAADAEFRTAVLLATKGLRFAQREGALDERAAVKLLAYAARMASRTTPFGLFASVGPAGFGAEERTVAPMRERRARANLGFDALVAAYDALLATARAGGDPDIAFVRASAIRRDGGRFVLSDERKTVEGEGGPQYRNVSIRISEPIAFALERAAQPGSARELVAALAERFGVAPERARSLLDRLADARFLVPASHPLPTDDALARLRASARGEARLEPLVAAAELAARDDAGALPDLAIVAERGAGLDALAAGPRRSTTRSSSMRPTGRCSCRRGCGPTSCGWPTRCCAAAAASTSTPTASASWRATSRANAGFRCSTWSRRPGSASRARAGSTSPRRRDKAADPADQGRAGAADPAGRADRAKRWPRAGARSRCATATGTRSCRRWPPTRCRPASRSPSTSSRPRSRRSAAASTGSCPPRCWPPTAAAAPRGASRSTRTTRSAPPGGGRSATARTAT